MVPIIYKIFLDNDYVSRNDIRVYFKDKFKQIKAGHSFKHLLPDPWPSSEMVDTLVDKSSGQFIYAATVIGYIESPRHRPDERLNAIFQLRLPFKDLPFTELDALYRLIIYRAEDLPTVLDILAFPALYGWFRVRNIEAILQLGRGSVEVLLADLHSVITIDHIGHVGFLHKSLGDFLDEPQRAGDLYRDLSRARLFHIARVISYFLTPKAQQDAEFDDVSTSITQPIGDVISSQFNGNPDITKANYVSSDILEAVDLFPTFSFFVHFLGPCSHRKRDVMFHFAKGYIKYLYYIKDVCESTKLVYSEQMQQYCKCVLAVLDNDYSGNWKAHFLYSYYHLLRDPRHSLPEELSYAIFHMLPTFDNCAECTFGQAICNIIPLDSDGNNSLDIIRISHDLTEGIKQASIFAMSASYCLALLCDEQSVRQDWHLMSKTSLFDPDTDTTVSRYTQKEVEQYIFLMDILPYVLPLAGRYELLVDMCRNKSFSPHSQLWPKKSGRAREAIDSYLRRMELQEGMENVVQ
ncbi:hypothetical protein D9613_003584 [Agrocybe pediades]|uniref:Uncharacterized protein n=1 Tax=Agrocybe pediades TaxID=84607 RepID=A0A8H4QJW7_9AGAR|nr:hypothetical protein D9613_003584 [Agrocybe pediades]